MEDEQSVPVIDAGEWPFKPKEERQLLLKRFCGDNQLIQIFVFS